MSFLERLLGKRKDDQWELPILQQICGAMLRQVPQDWKSAHLVLEVTENGLGSGLAHSAITRHFSKDGALRDGNFVTPDLQVMAATRTLELALAERKKTFKRAFISATEDGDGWQIKSEYE